MTSKHAPIPRQRSRLWHTAASLGEVDSLQNAVDAFKVRCGRRTHAMRRMASPSPRTLPSPVDHVPPPSPAHPHYCWHSILSKEPSETSAIMWQADDEIASGQHALETGSAGAAAKRTSPGSAGTPPPPQGFGRPRRAGGGGIPRRGSMGNLNAVSSPEADPAPSVGAQLPPAGPSAPYQARPHLESSYGEGREYRIKLILQTN